MSINERIVHPIAPFVPPHAHILILGSFPSVRSRETAFFYGHPQNRFWQMLSTVYGESAPASLDEKKMLLTAHGIALYDVLSACSIRGSADSTIKNVVPSDLSPILAAAPIEHILCNGKTSYHYYEKYQHPHLLRNAVPLPSTSPANAGCSLSRLVIAWQTYLT